MLLHFPYENIQSGWPAGIQTATNCNDLVALPFFDTFKYAAIKALKTIADLLTGAQMAHAKGGGGGGGDCTLLDLLLNDSAHFDNWTQTIGVGIMTYTNPLGDAFTYNVATGEVAIL